MRVRSTTLTLIAVFMASAGCGESAAPASQDNPPDPAVEVGPPASAVAVVDPPTTEAGQAAIVACELRDAEGRAIEAHAWSFVVTPTEDVTVAGIEVTGTAPGEHKVVCSFDMAPDVPQLPATWTVVPGGPTTLVLTLTPDKPGYMVGEEITVTARAIDAMGNEKEGEAPIGALAATPIAEVSTDGNVISFGAPGTYVVTATHAIVPEAKGEVVVLVDGTPPVITVTDPERGLTRAWEPSYGVTGTVVDELLDVDWLRHGTSNVPVEADGTFWFEWDLVFGVNLLALQAADTAGNMAETWRSLMWSSDWYHMDPPKADTDAVGGGLAITLTQAALDDGDHTGDPDDVATLVEAVLSGLDPMTLLGGAPLGEFLFCEYLVTKLEYTDPGVIITLHDGYLQAVIRLNLFKVWMKNSGVNQGAQFQCTLNDGPPDGPTWATGPLKFEADAMIITANVTLAMGADGPEVKVDIAEVDFENMWGIDIPGISNIVDWAIETFVGLLTPLIGGLLNDTFSGLIAGFAIEQEFDLPALGGGEPNTVKLSTAISNLQTSKESLRIVMDGLAATQNIQRPFEVLGVPAWTGCEPTTPLPIDPLQPLLLGLHTDLLNQILFAVWDGGTLNTTIDPSALGDFDLSGLGIENLEALVDARLPLLFNACGKATRMQIGDLYLDATMDFAGTPTHIALWIQGDIPVAMGVLVTEEGTKELGFELGALDDLVMEVVINDGLFAGDDATLLAIVKSALLPKLLEGLAGGLGSFPLPEIDLAALAPGLPEGTKFAIGIEIVETKGGYVRVLGKLE